MNANGWEYEKVCLDELLKLAPTLIANFLIHLVMTSTVYLPQNFNRTTEQNFLKMWVEKIKTKYLYIRKTIY